MPSSSSAILPRTKRTPKLQSSVTRVPSNTDTPSGTELDWTGVLLIWGS
jgi:hypothetical protein